VKLLMLVLHPSCTLQRLADMLVDGPLKGVVFCWREKAAVRLSAEGMRLVQRLVQGGGGGGGDGGDGGFDFIDCLHFQAWGSGSDDSGRGGDGRTISLAENQLASLSLPESSCAQIRETLSFAAAVGGDVQRDDDVGVCELVDCIQLLAGVQLDLRCVLQRAWRSVVRARCCKINQNCARAAPTLAKTVVADTHVADKHVAETQMPPLKLLTHMLQSRASSVARRMRTHQ